MYKIFFKERVIFLTSDISASLSDDFNSILKYANIGELATFIQNFEQDTTLKKAYIYHHNELELLKKFRSCFKNLPAAGGLVWNSDKSMFIGMKRRGYFDLPKGKTEAGETFEEAAVREVKEECNIEDVTLIRQLTTTYHTYRLNDKPVFKETKWFEMGYNSSTQPSPQIEEDIEQVDWIDPKKLRKYIKNTYPSIIEVLTSAGLIT